MHVLPMLMQASLWYGNLWRVHTVSYVGTPTRGFRPTPAIAPRPSKRCSVACCLITAPGARWPRSSRQRIFTARITG
ncbi:MAG: hypothetical protein MZV64_71710 [Ignavibacteriales bacterium]|nr:hypothetical protein [Ignavibacteriales bacterium]